jgi:hypothetical protein
MREYKIKMCEAEKEVGKKFEDCLEMFRPICGRQKYCVNCSPKIKKIKDRKNFINWTMKQRTLKAAGIITLGMFFMGCTLNVAGNKIGNSEDKKMELSPYISTTNVNNAKTTTTSTNNSMNTNNVNNSKNTNVNSTANVNVSNSLLKK